MYDKTFVPVFRVEKIDGNFLGFVFEHFTAEKQLLEGRGDEIDWPLIDRIKEMHDDDVSFREIAIEVGRSKTTVHRLLQMWKPHDKHPVCFASTPPLKGGELDPTTSPFYFPGIEEYDEADRDPRLHNLGQGPEFTLRNREGYLIQLSRGKAREEYAQTGRAPTLAEMKQRLPEWRELLAAQALEAGIDGETATRSDAGAPISASTSPGLAASSQNGSDPIHAIPWAAGLRRLRVTDLKRGLNAYGKEIFIESEDERGKPKVWYRLDSKGRANRSERKPGGGIIVTQMSRDLVIR